MLGSPDPKSGIVHCTVEAGCEDLQQNDQECSAEEAGAVLRCLAGAALCRKLR